MSRNPGENETKSDVVLRLGACDFDLSRMELRNATGALIPLRAQSGKVLAALASSVNQVLEKDELIGQVWQGKFVTDDSLVQCIADIRRALGTVGHEIVETFPKKGYRLNVVSLTNARADIPERPAIAVLPFVNLSGDIEQEFFADGMTEDVIAGLSQFRSLLVISRNSSFSFKGKSPDVRQVAKDLNVRYILEGSVRKVGKRIRITGQLVDAARGNHLWAGKFDRELEDIFTIQDEITNEIVALIAPEIDYVERQRARRSPPERLDVWGLYQRGLELHQSAMGDACKLVIEQFDQVCELDPTFALGFAMAASARVRFALLFEPDDREELLVQALEKSRQGITLDTRDSTCLWAHGRVLTMMGNYDAAITSIEGAIALNPNDSLAHYYLSIALGSAGRLEDAVAKIDHALRLSPLDVAGGGFQNYKAFVLFDLERYEEAIECAQQAIREPYPLSVPFEVMAAALVKLGRPEEARVAVGDLLEHTPDASLSSLSGRPWIGRPETKARFLGALREAGLVE